MSSLPITPPETQGLSADRLNHIPRFFSAYLEAGKLPHMATLISRGGDIVHLGLQGQMQIGQDRPISEDTLFRIYSMTKPITALAAMILFEEGRIRLEHAVSRYIPEFSDPQVWVGGTSDAPELAPAAREITLLDLFTHTSGLTYGFLRQHPVDGIYRAEKIGEGHEPLQEMVRRMAPLPLVFSPGERWNYGHSTDVLGAIVEIVSGQSLDVFFKTRIFEPLGMVDTDFHVPSEKLDRLPACYMKNPKGGAPLLFDGAGTASHLFQTRPTLLNAGGGLISTLSDYHRFALMLLKGGALDGVRLVSPKTIDFMTRNHLPGGNSILGMGDKTFAEGRMHGHGFCLLGSVLEDLIAFGQPGSEGTYAWGGLASTYFWVDPLEEMICIQMTQLVPSNSYPLRTQFQQLAYAALEI